MHAPHPLLDGDGDSRARGGSLRAEQRTGERGVVAAIAELRELALPAYERIARGPQSDDLRRRVDELDRELQELAPPDSMFPFYHGLDESALAGARDERSAWLERARPALDRWLDLELCGTPPSDAGDSEDWMSLARRVDLRLDRRERIAREVPRLARLRNWANLLAWHAYFQSLKPEAERQWWELNPGRSLASVFRLVAAFDDGSPLAMSLCSDVERQTLRAALNLMRQRRVSAQELRLALDKVLAARAAAEPAHMIEAGLRQCLIALERGSVAADERLSYFARVDEAFQLAVGTPAEFFVSRAAFHESHAGPGTFESLCVSGLSSLYLQRSVNALFRVGLAIEEFRERTGALPASLDEIPLAPFGALPLDPVTDAPFPWVVEGGTGRLGPAASPVLDAAGGPANWAKGVELLLAWEF